MKKLYSLIICTMAMLALYSCGLFEDEKPSKDSGDVKTIVELPDSIKKKIVEQDALMTELLNKVDTLTKEMNSTKTENAELKEQIAELKSPKSTWAYVSIGAFFLGLIALIMTLFSSQGLEEEKVYDIFKNCLDESSRIKDLQSNVNDLLSSKRNSKIPKSSSSYVSNSDTRLHQLENRLEQLIAVVNKLAITGQQTISSPQENTKSYENLECQKIGYAKVDTDMYFTTIYDSNQEGCVFKITFTSQSEGKFNIIALDKIQSRNDWQKKVECTGISIKEASGFRLEEDGICERLDEKTWKVTKPLKIRLLK